MLLIDATVRVAGATAPATANDTPTTATTSSPRIILLASVDQGKSIRPHTTVQPLKLVVGSIERHRFDAPIIYPVYDCRRLHDFRANFAKKASIFGVTAVALSTAFLEARALLAGAGARVGAC